VRDFREHTGDRILRDRGRVTGVRTPAGEIAAEYVVNCAGMWARAVGRMAGVNVPLQAAEHYYLISEPSPACTRCCRS
jgi:glycine/D-amino acid oxidase-like deaminating enzyme